MIESTRMMLDWLGRDRKVPQAVAAAASMGQATTAALADPVSRTKDIRGTGATEDMTRAIIRGIEREELHAYA
jgi:3-isopropylmalate dehydrogenase